MNCFLTFCYGLTGRLRWLTKRQGSTLLYEAQNSSHDQAAGRKASCRTTFFKKPVRKDYLFLGSHNCARFSHSYSRNVSATCSNPTLFDDIQLLMDNYKCRSVTNKPKPCSIRIAYSTI